MTRTRRTLRRVVTLTTSGGSTTTTTVVEDHGEGSAEIDRVLDEAVNDAADMEQTVRGAFAGMRGLFDRMRRRGR